jgi:hypothetical protein
MPMVIISMPAPRKTSKTGIREFFYFFNMFFSFFFFLRSPIQIQNDYYNNDYYNNYPPILTDTLRYKGFYSERVIYSTLEILVGQWTRRRFT